MIYDFFWLYLDVERLAFNSFRDFGELLEFLELISKVILKMRFPGNFREIDQFEI
jgi:hypothetical protein